MMIIDYTVPSQDAPKYDLMELKLSNVPRNDIDQDPPNEANFKKVCEAIQKVDYNFYENCETAKK